MLERLKIALVQSYVGAIAIGLTLSSGISQVARLAVNPVTVWQQQRQYGDNYPIGLPRPAPFASALPQLLMAVLLLLVAYGLLRWLYYPRAEEQDRRQDQASEPAQDT